MFAIVEAEMSTRLSAPRCSRSGDSGALVSENGTDAASLMVSLPESSHSRYARHLGKRFPFSANLSNWGEPRKTVLPALAGSAGARRPGPRAVSQHDLARDRDDARLSRCVVAQYQPRGDLAEPLERQPHRGERRIDVAQGDNVVEAGQGD